jgi:hypothetical protein
LPRILQGDFRPAMSTTTTQLAASKVDEESRARDGSIKISGTSPYMHNASSRISVLKNASDNTHPEDLELQQLPGSSKIVDGGQTAETPSPLDPFVTHKWLANLQYASLCWSLFLAGWNDGTTGPLLPRIQEVYHVCISSGIRILAKESFDLS